MAGSVVSSFAGASLRFRQRIFTNKTAIQRQALRRIEARIAVLTCLQRDLDDTNPDTRQFLMRNRRAIAELEWFRLVLQNSGTEPDFDDDDNLIPPKKAARNQTQKTEG